MIWAALHPASGVIQFELNYYAVLAEAKENELKKLVTCYGYGLGGGF